MPTAACLFFFALLPPPPRSTLFPYTTLFRSAALASRREARARAVVRLGRADDRRTGHGRNLEDARRPADEYLDRKSTRLNSSHRTISYAVFCLKKKKRNHNNIIR